jgi:hypothetical protein
MAERVKKSPYQRYGKQPYPYTFPRCSHAHTHPETFAVGTVKARQRVRVAVCDVCHTIRSEPEFLASRETFKRAA